MNRSIKVKALEERAVAALLAAPRFNILSPARCRDCGNTHHFERRLFRVWGVPMADRSSDDVQGMIAYHLRTIHGLDHVFFKSYKNRFYVDSAICKKCGRTSVAFDIELTDEVLARLSELAGKPPAGIRADVEALAGQIMNRLEKH